MITARQTSYDRINKFARKLNAKPLEEHTLLGEPLAIVLGKSYNPDEQSYESFLSNEKDPLLRFLKYAIQENDVLIVQGPEDKETQEKIETIIEGAREKILARTPTKIKVVQSTRRSLVDKIYNTIKGLATKTPEIPKTEDEKTALALDFCREVGATPTSYLTYVIVNNPELEEISAKLKKREIPFRSYRTN